MLNLKMIIGSTRPGRLCVTAARMNTSATQPAAPVTARPSRLVRATFGPLTRVLNPAMLKLAGRRDVRMAARVRPRGRRSGRRYVTPVGARLTGDTFVIPLTFGNQSDWSRNVRAAGGCEIRLYGTDYRAVPPELADGEQVREVIRAAFSPVERSCSGCWASGSSCCSSVPAASRDKTTVKSPEAPLTREVVCKLSGRWVSMRAERHAPTGLPLITTAWPR